MRFMTAFEARTDPVSQFFACEEAVNLIDTSFRMSPAGLDGIEPGALGGQIAGQDAYAPTLPLDLLVVCAYPSPDGFADVPWCIVPDQRQDFLARSLQFLASPGQELGRHSANWTAVYKAQPDPLLEVLRIRRAGDPHPIAGQGFRFFVAFRDRLLNHSQALVPFGPGM
jgi:hypothetical protein